MSSPFLYITLLTFLRIANGIKDRDFSTFVSHCRIVLQRQQHFIRNWMFPFKKAQHHCFWLSTIVNILT